MTFPGVFPVGLFNSGGVMSVSSLLALLVSLRSTATKTNVANYYADAFYDQTGINAGSSTMFGTSSKRSTSPPLA